MSYEEQREERNKISDVISKIMPEVLECRENMTTNSRAERIRKEIESNPSFSIRRISEYSSHTTTITLPEDQVNRVIEAAQSIAKEPRYKELEAANEAAGTAYMEVSHAEELIKRSIEEKYKDAPPVTYGISNDDPHFKEKLRDRLSVGAKVVNIDSSDGVALEKSQARIDAAGNKFDAAHAPLEDYLDKKLSELGIDGVPSTFVRRALNASYLPPEQEGMHVNECTRGADVSSSAARTATTADKATQRLQECAETKR